MHVFPHATDWERDFYFSGAYFMALSTDGSDYMFPTYAMEANKMDKTNRNNSTGVSALWKRQLLAIFDVSVRAKAVFELLVQTELLQENYSFTPGLCSHSAKKYSVRTMGQHLTAIYIIFRAGWKVENAHTLFDYLTRSTHHDIKAAKTCAGWTTPWHDEIWGGYSNCIDDLESHALFDEFTRMLFRNKYKK